MRVVKAWITWAVAWITWAAYQIQIRDYCRECDRIYWRWRHWPHRHARRCVALPPLGERGALWRCACRRLWRVGEACDSCDRYGGHPSGRGQCAVGLAWRPASLGQRIRHWRST